MGSNMNRNKGKVRTTPKGVEPLHPVLLFNPFRGCLHLLSNSPDSIRGYSRSTTSWLDAGLLQTKKTDAEFITQRF